MKKYPEGINSKVKRRIFDYLKVRPEGSTALQIAVDLNVSPHYCKKCIATLFEKRLLTVVGYGKNYDHSKLAPRLYAISSSEVAEPAPLPRRTKAPKADLKIQAHAVKRAKSHGLFGVLVTQLTGD